MKSSLKAPLLLSVFALVACGQNDQSNQAAAAESTYHEHIYCEFPSGKIIEYDFPAKKQSTNSIRGDTYIDVYDENNHKIFSIVNTPCTYLWVKNTPVNNATISNGDFE